MQITFKINGIRSTHKKKKTVFHAHLSNLLAFAQGYLQGIPFANTNGLVLKFTGLYGICTAILKHLMRRELTVLQETPLILKY